MPRHARIVLALVVALSATVGAGTARATEVLYVANADSGPVFGYNAYATGSVAPIREADNPNNPNTVWDPWSLAFDSAGNLYVQTFLSDATTFVFAPDPRRGDAPTRIFSAYGPDTRAVAVDGNGFEYVASGESGAEIAVAPPGAEGAPANGYFINPLRTFSANENGFQPWPDILTIGKSNELLVGIVGSRSNAVETYAGGAAGSSLPLRVLAGRHTGLGSCAGYGNCDQLAITFTPRSGLLYVAVSAGASQAHISEFRVTANGNVAPIRRIAGAATGLSGKVITGIAVSQVTGEIYAMVKSAPFFAPGQIEAFGARAAGNAAPLRTFTDSTGQFTDALGIAVHAGE